MRDDDNTILKNFSKKNFKKQQTFIFPWRNNFSYSGYKHSKML